MLVVKNLLKVLLAISKALSNHQIFFVAITLVIKFVTPALTKITGEAGN